MTIHATDESGKKDAHVREVNMISNLIKALAFGSFVIGASGMANAQQSPTQIGSQTNIRADVTDVGKYEYEGHCAICHGSNGTGQDREPYWNLLSKTIPNLTTLSKRNGGVFPFALVYEVIDGRQAVQAHGPRDMPIWGREFNVNAPILNAYYDPEAFARAKILALTDYVYRLQAK